jgi:glutamate 5-kinase
VENESRLSHFKDTVFRLLQLGAIPIINENDTVSTAEIAVGDNDTLAAIVGVNVNADLVVLLSDIDGLYTADPKQDKGAKLIENIEKIDDGIERLAKGAGSDLGTGGMITKLNAAKICVKNGIDMIIANGSQPENLYKIVEGEKVGTRFKGKV